MGLSPLSLKLLATLPVALAVAWVVLDGPAPDPQPVARHAAGARRDRPARPGREAAADGLAGLPGQAGRPLAQAPPQAPAATAAWTARGDVPGESANARQQSGIVGQAKADVREARLPLFYMLDDEKIVAAIPVLTLDGLQVLRQKFEEEAGVGTLPVDDPAYAQRWQQAELTLEQRMRLWYGWSAWGAFQHQAAIESARNNQVAAQ